MTTYQSRAEIITPDAIFVPTLIDSVRWISSRSGSPTKLEMTVAKDHVIDYQEGDLVLYKLDDKPVFRGFIFTKRRNKEANIKNTVYDQLRYLKNKVSFQVNDVNAEGVIKFLCELSNLPKPKVEGISDVRLPRHTFEDKELFEIIEWVSAQQTILSGEIPVLYDDAGTLCYKNIELMKVEDQVFTPKEMVDWDYESTIDKGTFNSIVIHHEAQESGEKTIVTKDDKAAIARWGVLRYTAKSNEPLPDVQNKAEKLLQTTSRKVRTLKLKQALGNPNVRGGSLVKVALPLGDIELNAWMIVKDVTHTIKGNKYTMDITVENRALGFADAVSPDGVFKNIQNKKLGGKGRLPGNTNAEKICNALLNLGFTLEAACGILGNIDRETGGTYDPAIVQAGGAGPGRGLCQWESSAMGGSGRWEQLVSWCRSNGYGEETIDGQMAYLKYELTSPSSWVNTTSMPMHAGMKGYDFLALTDVDKATEAFIRGYEIPADPYGGLQRSLGPARTYYNQWKAQLSEKSSKKGSGVIGHPLPGATVTNRWTGPNYQAGQHIGIDLSISTGSPVLAADDGNVLHAGYGEDSTYGISIYIDHGNGIRTRYAHLNSIAVQAGQGVDKGQVIGYQGYTGHVIPAGPGGSHLHFEVYANGANVDPARYI